MKRGMDVYDLICERGRRVIEMAALPPAERIEALLALRAEVESVRGKGMVLGDKQIARELARARREITHANSG